MKTAAVVYCRVSTQEQTENYSLGTQEHACRDYCKRHGLTLDRVFVEEGQSAKTINRTQFGKMLEYCFEGKGRIQCVVVYNVSRFSRSLQDYQNVRNELRKVGIELRSVTEQFNDTSSGKLMESMLATFAQFDNDVRAERTVEGMKAALAARRWPFRPPLGYLKGGLPGQPSIVPDPKKGPLIQTAFEMFAQGSFKMRQVLDHITKLGLTNAKDKKINLQTFVLTLRRPIYAGWMTVSDWTEIEPIKGDFTPLISQETFDAVQRILRGRQGTTTKHLRSHPDFPLRRFVRCGCCGRSLTGSWSKNRKLLPYGYYRCASSACKAVNVRRERMHELFYNLLESLKPGFEFLALFEAVVMDVWESSRIGAVTLVASLKGQLESLEEKRDQLEEVFVFKKNICQDTYRRLSEKLAAEILAKKIELSEAQTDEFDVEGALSFARKMLENAAAFWQPLPSEKKESFQKIVFPDGVTFLNGEFGTTATNPIFKHLQSGLGKEEEMATRHGFEP